MGKTLSCTANSLSMLREQIKPIDGSIKQMISLGGLWKDVSMNCYFKIWLRKVGGGGGGNLGFLNCISYAQCVFVGSTPQRNWLNPLCLLLCYFIVKPVVGPWKFWIWFGISKSPIKYLYLICPSKPSHFMAIIEFMIQSKNVWLLEKMRKMKLRWNFHANAWWNERYVAWSCTSRD